MNLIVLKGNLTRDVEVRYASTGTAYARFSIACKRPYQANANANTKDVDFIECAAFGKSAENIGKFFIKGSEILVRGRLQESDYTDKDGNKRKSFTVLVDSFEFCGKKSDSSAMRTATPTENQNGGQSVNSDYTVDGVSEEDLPF